MVLDLQVNIRIRNLKILPNARLAKQKLKKKKSPAQVARDCFRQKECWKRMKVARQLTAENIALNYLLQETDTVAMPQSSVVSQSELYKPDWLDRTLCCVYESDIIRHSQKSNLNAVFIRMKYRGLHAHLDDLKKHTKHLNFCL